VPAWAAWPGLAVQESPSVPAWVEVHTSDDHLLLITVFLALKRCVIDVLHVSAIPSSYGGTQCSGIKIQLAGTEVR